MPKFKVGDIIVGQDSANSELIRKVICHSSDGQVVYEFINENGRAQVFGGDEDNFILRPKPKVKQEYWYIVSYDCPPLGPYDSQERAQDSAMPNEEVVCLSYEVSEP